MEFRTCSLEGVGRLNFWQGKKVLVTGHTGFKGSWLSLWLQKKGADLTGYALEPPGEPNVFNLLDLSQQMVSITGDIRDYNHIKDVFIEQQPEMIFHLAAQSLVRKSYSQPLETIHTNVLGTAHVLEAARQTDSVRVVINVTSDKCYQNEEWCWGYRENDRLGGDDPYSSSKGCAELITSAYRKSFYKETGMVLCSVRAGNVIGGGDWGEDRLVPDIFRAITANRPVLIRYPGAIRPWQHVLDPLSGYLLLAKKSFQEGHQYGGAWNFGPSYQNELPVSLLTNKIVDAWGFEKGWMHETEEKLPETNYLRLDSAKARTLLNWRSLLNFSDAVDWTVKWYKNFSNNANVQAFTLKQIEAYESKQNKK